VAARATPRGWPEFSSELPGVLRLGLACPKTVRGHRDSYLGFNVAGDGLKVAVGGGLAFSSFDGVARPHPRFSGPRNWFPRFLALSSRSYPVQLHWEATNLVIAAFASGSRV
jgi:hypothetical protein